MDSTHVMIAGSAMVIGFHLADLFAHRLRIPSVLFLMAFGAIASLAASGSDLPIRPPQELLTGMGLLGLALIVLEGSMGLVWRPGTEKTMLSGTVSAMACIVLFLVPAAMAFHALWGGSWRVAILNAIPLAVVSSAIAIPSAARLPEASRDFISVETSLSYIVGVLLFNAVAVPGALGIGTLFHMGWSALLVLVVSVAIVGTTLRIMRHSSQGVRFVPLLASLLLFFSVGKLLHLPSLLLVFLFGLAVANLPHLRVEPVRKFLMHDGFRQDAHLLETMVRELAFLARTFFFFLFGYSLEFDKLAHPMPWLAGILLVGLVYLGRYLVLRGLGRPDLRRVLFIAPRGLITLLLFGMIPVGERLDGIASGAILVVVLGTTFGQMLGGKDVSEAAGMPSIDELLPIGPQRRNE